MRYYRHPALRPKGPAIKRLFKFIPDKFVEMTATAGFNPYKLIVIKEQFPLISETIAL